MVAGVFVFIPRSYPIHTPSSSCPVGDKLTSLPIGSGAEESSVKQFKARLPGAGMRWSRPGAERMLIIRAAVLPGDFDTLWQHAA